MKLSLLAGIAAAAFTVMAGNASAFTISGVLVPPNTTPFNLDSFGTGNGLGLQPTLSPINVGGETISFTGPSGVFSGNVTNVVKSPFPANDNTNYLAAQPTGTLNIAFATPQTAFNLLWGSVDTYNGLTFLAGGTVITGADIAAAVPGILLGTSNAAITISGLASFTSISVTSTSSAFEFVPGTAVPEPVTLAILGTGLVGLGFARRRRA